jgi:glyoxylate utilization-related uncharacterized protein
MNRLVLSITMVLSSFGVHAEEKAFMLSSDQVPYEGKDIKTAWVWHAPDNSSGDAMLRWPAGLAEDNSTEPVSVHPFGVRIVVVAGTLLFQFAGGETKELQAGSYIYAPPGAKHALACKAGGPECVMFAVFTPPPGAKK